MNLRSIRLAVAAALLMCSAAPLLAAPKIERTPGTATSASVNTVNQYVFPAATYGTSQDPLVQVEEAVTKMHEALKKQGLGIGNMVQHTVYLKDGAAPPIAVLTKFHETATKLAPSLKQFKSVGTIIRVPSFPDKNTAVQIDVVAAVPAVKGKHDGYSRVNFVYGPAEIAETYAVEPFVFTSGLEAMDFQYGKLPKDIDPQMEVIVNKLSSSLKGAGLTVGNMISHNLYVKRGTDPIHVIQKFHELTQKIAPELKQKPSVGTLVVVDGMAGDGFLLEMDAIAARPQEAGKPDSYKRVKYPGMETEISKTVTVDDLVYVAGMEGMDPVNPANTSKDPLVQVAVAVKKIDAALRESGLTIGNMVKHKLYVKQGTDVAKMVAKFHEEAQKLAPELKNKPSAQTVVVVEGLAIPELAFEASVIAAGK